MATKEDKRQVRGVIEGLEWRVHRGPPVRPVELESVRDFLLQRGFSPASDYYGRLVQIQNRLHSRPTQPAMANGKHNYGGEAAGRLVQVQSVYDHLIFSTCYEGDFNTKHGRIKISHRFNREGRLDFIELKFLRSLHPCLNGELRKLLLVQHYQSLRKDWHEADAFVLETLPRELVFLYGDIFHSERSELFAWLINTGHGLVSDVLKDLRARELKPCPAFHGQTGEVTWSITEGGAPEAADGLWSRTTQPLGRSHARCFTSVLEPEPVRSVSRNHHGRPPFPASAPRTNGNGDSPEESGLPTDGKNHEQLRLQALLRDAVALPMLERAAALESAVELLDAKTVRVRYLTK